jgi:hypothetical protein
MLITMNPLTPKEIIETLLNGNLTRATEDATFYSMQTLIQEAMGIGYNYNDALIMGAYLTGQIPFQDYADNFNNTKP